MVGPYKVITICGSTRFKEQFLEAQKRLTLEGNIVISVGGYIGSSTGSEIEYARSLRSGWLVFNIQSGEFQPQI